MLFVGHPPPRSDRKVSHVGSGAAPAKATAGAVPSKSRFKTKTCADTSSQAAPRFAPAAPLSSVFSISKIRDRPTDIGGDFRTLASENPQN